DATGERIHDQAQRHQVRERGNRQRDDQPALLGEDAIGGGHEDSPRFAAAPGVDAGGTAGVGFSPGFAPGLAPGSTSGLASDLTPASPSPSFFSGLSDSASGATPG